MMDDENVDVEATPDSTRVVAIYDFDPSTIDWPFRRQRPLQLKRGWVIKVIHDDGSEWAMGHPVGAPKLKGYFPKNYTVSVAEYHDMLSDYQQAEMAQEAAPEDDPHKGLDPEQPMGPPPTSAFPTDTLPKMDAGKPSIVMQLADEDDVGELVYPGVAKYPVLEPAPPVATTFELTKSRLLRDMPMVPGLRPEAPGPPKDEIEEALKEVEKEEEMAKADPRLVPGGMLTDSRASTPATHALTRPERDFVRRNLDPKDQGRKMGKLSTLRDVIGKNIRMAREEAAPYPKDMRVRSTTSRVAAGIEVQHMRFALGRGSDSGARWTQMFRPGFNDIVNESFKVGCNACILSRSYLEDPVEREKFQKLHVKDVNGTLWFELQRKKKHYFYMRMENVDVMMCHPDAWGFPDTTHTVHANPGEPFNPFHGWYAQHAIDTDREMQEDQTLTFCYTLRLRAFKDTTFTSLALGKIPEWIQPYTSLHGEASLEDVRGGGGEGKQEGGGKGLNVDKALLAEAGLDETDDVYVKFDELRLARERTVGPDVLDERKTSYRLKGLSAMRIFLRSRGRPDNMKQTMITPKIVKDMAAQLGIKGDWKNYWYCKFALRYPLAPEWEVVVKNDTRWYVHLPTDRPQPIHPLIQKFRDHLNDIIQNDFLWDFRGFVGMKCGECGVPDSSVWCMQCTDYFCAPCLFATHKSPRGKKHWLMPVPGSRYLTKDEADRFQPHLHLLNVGFSNRRRFLARDNQSDKMGSRNGDSWLYFGADTFGAALLQAPKVDKDRFFLKRMNPPRLAPDADGYYYNFERDSIADDHTHILHATHEQKAISLLQKTIRGTVTRNRVRLETEAVLVFQKSKKMWDCQKIYGNNGRNAGILKSWYRKYKARLDRDKLERQVAHVQAVFHGRQTRKWYARKVGSLTNFQAAYRGILGRRHIGKLTKAIIDCQRLWRGWDKGRRKMQKKAEAASKIQALARGVAHRHAKKDRVKKATAIQAHLRGLLARKRVARMHQAVLKIQTNHRRFQAQIEVKRILYERLHAIREKRAHVLRLRVQDAAVLLIQRNWRKYVDYQKVIFMRKEKGDADKRIQTLMVALFAAVAELRHHVHPWFRHLPTEIQEVLEQIKNSLQRTIALVPVTGKLANEEIGKRGLRVAHEKDLTYVQTGKDPDLASHLFLSVTRHLLSLVPAELFPATVKWACYAISHKAVDLVKEGFIPKQEIQVGKDMPPHPGDNLASLWQDTDHVRVYPMDYDIEGIKLPEVSLPCLTLHGLSAHHRQVFLTAQVLITMRQALETPSLSTEDHLKFQGLDKSAGAQLMQVLASELDHELELSWPTMYGTVATLATQMATHITELVPDKDVKDAKPKRKPKPKKEKDPDAPEEPKKKKPAKPKVRPKGSRKKVDDAEDLERVEGGIVMNFNRKALLRIVQQVGYLMRDQDKLLDSVISTSEGTGHGHGIRQSRYISVTDKLFDMADHAKHDHCSFVLAVVIFHMVLRGLLMRVTYDRAAIAMQKRYRYLKDRGDKGKQIPFAIFIQRYWRGLSASLRCLRMVEAGLRIQHSWRIFKWNQRANTLLTATLKIQRVWRGAIQRLWLHHCHASATTIQRFVKGQLIRAVLDKPGRDLARRFQNEMNQLIRSQEAYTETRYAALTAALAGKTRVAMHKHRVRNVDLQRNRSFSLRSKHTRKTDRAKKMAAKGHVQPVRETYFEPLVFASARLEPPLPPRMGGQRSRVLNTAALVHRQLDSTLPKATPGVPHAIAKRGREAIIARRLAKKAKMGDIISGPASSKKPLFDEKMLDRWAIKTFQPTRH
mmetsp:Transcript_133457/g.231981  ORF Transcript_133457/g.231981 Transcript_133457/m.231981 type:complete len:1798 (+) Transcript_133457:140-5533(+)